MTTSFYSESWLSARSWAPDSEQGVRACSKALTGNIFLSAQLLNIVLVDSLPSFPTASSPHVRSGKPSTLLIRFHFSYISPSRFPFTVLLELSKEMPLNYLFLMTLFIKLFSIAPDSHSMGAFMDLFKDVQADMDGGHLPRHSFLCCVFLEGMVTKDSAGTGCETSLQPVWT